MPPIDETALYVKNLIEANKIVIFSKTTCPWCDKVKELFKSINEEYVCISLDEIGNGEEIKSHLKEKTGQSTVPNVFIRGSHIGGYDKTAQAQKDGSLAKLLNPEPATTNGTTPQAKRPKTSESKNESTESFVKDLLEKNKVVIFSKTTCPWCDKVKELFKGINEEYTAISLDEIDNGDAIKAYLIEKTGQSTVPNVFIRGAHMGGYDKTAQAQKDGRLAKLLAVPTADNKPKPGESIESFVTNLIQKNKVVIFSKTTCPFCAKVKELFKSLNEETVVIEIDTASDGPAIRDYLIQKTGQRTVPSVYVRGIHLGGCDNTFNAHTEGQLQQMLAPLAVDSQTPVAETAAAPAVEEQIYDYDLVVIGGGSGGLACSKAAASLDQKVAVLDFVKPTPTGTSWGLGGTCVNVGCIPKKLMHQSALLGESLKDSVHFGWQTPENIKHNWDTMKQNIQDHIGSLNWNYRVQLRDKKVEYINSYGEFIDNHRLLLTQKNGKTKEITAKKIVVAVGGRPKYPENTPGAIEHCITSDDLFSLSYNPGKTLCVGASYVSLECAGFLHGIGLDVTVMVRSILLRGFDQQMANIIGDYMEGHSIKFHRGCVPIEITRLKEVTETEAGEVLVKYKNEKGEVLEEKFNTVVIAVGRDPCTKNLNIDKAGVKLNKSGKIITNYEQTNIDNIYAIGDVVEELTANGRVLELTPVAIRQGQLLAARMFAKSEQKMEYNCIPTTVFTPIEYGAIGYSEEEATELYGAENIEVYHGNYWPLEWTVAHRPNDVCYAKLICNKKDNERVVGFHVAGPNAGEITQGYAVAMKLKATKKDFDMTIGIHPTCSEIFTGLTVTKSSGSDIKGAGC